MSAANTPDSSRLAQAFDEFVKSTQKENTAFRKEILKRDQATARKLDVLQTELTRTKENGVVRKSVAENNAWVAADDFKIVIGPGTEQLADFESKWTGFMRSSIAHDKVKTTLAELEMQTINDTGVELEPNDPSIFWDAVLPVALECRKGAHLSPDPGASEPFNAPLSLPRSRLPSSSFSSAVELVPELAEYVTDSYPDVDLTDMNAQFVYTLLSDDEDSNRVYAKAFLKLKNNQIMTDLKGIRAAARTTKTNAVLKLLAYKHMPFLVSRSSDLSKDVRATGKARAGEAPGEARRVGTTSSSLLLLCLPLLAVCARCGAQGETYEASKTLMQGTTEDASNWPRPCNLLFGKDEDGKPLFLHPWSTRTRWRR